jgi:hypothetical protein
MKIELMVSLKIAAILSALRGAHVVAWAVIMVIGVVFIIQL